MSLPTPLSAASGCFFLFPLPFGTTVYFLLFLKLYSLICSVFWEGTKHISLLRWSCFCWLKLKKGDWNCIWICPILFPLFSSSHLKAFIWPQYSWTTLKLIPALLHTLLSSLLSESVLYPNLHTSCLDPHFPSLTFFLLFFCCFYSNPFALRADLPSWI